MTDITAIKQFLGCATPVPWLEAAMANLPTLLIDHAHCEKKAASTAMNLLYRYVDREDLLFKLSQLAREELLHFEQVLEMMKVKGITYDHMTPSRYASGLRKHVRTHEPEKLIDTLIVGAFIEARSCERFEALAPRLDTVEEHQDIARYYRFLLKSESRHYEDYLALASSYSPTPIDERVCFFREIESNLIQESDTEFRFHSGPPSPSH